MEMKFYKVKKGSAYHKALVKAKEDSTTLYNTSEQVREEFGMSTLPEFSNHPDFFYHEYASLTDEQQKQFKKDGVAKKNSKIHKRYIELVTAAGLNVTYSPSTVHFMYGMMMRSNRETLQRMRIRDDYYIKTDCDFGRNTEAYLDEITEVDYLQVQLDAAKEEATI